MAKQILLGEDARKVIGRNDNNGRRPKTNTWA